MTDNVAGKKMVVGFLFSGLTVLLVRKTRPYWQVGLLNGVGGVIEENETPIDAMRREFEEETGCSIELGWRHFCTEIEPFGAYVYFFTADLAAEHQRETWPTSNDVGEALKWCHVYPGLRSTSRIGNLSWLIPLARDPRGLGAVTMTAHGDIREMASW